MSLLSDLQADLVSVFIDPADFAVPVVCLSPDMATTITFNGIWHEVGGNGSDEQAREHDHIFETVAILRCAASALPSGDPGTASDVHRCRFYRASNPNEVYGVRSIMSGQSGLAKLTLFHIDVEDRHARQDHLRISP